MSVRIIARANKMFTRAAATMAKAQKLLASVSEVGTAPAKKTRVAKVAPVVKKTRVAKVAKKVVAPVKKARRAVAEEVAPKAKKIRRAAVEIDEAPVRKVRAAKVVEAAPVSKRTKSSPVLDAPASKTKAVPKNVRIQVEDDFPDL